MIMRMKRNAEVSASLFTTALYISKCRALGVGIEMTFLPFNVSYASITGRIKWKGEGLLF